jgi:hypothetical protein
MTKSDAIDKRVSEVPDDDNVDMTIDAMPTKELFIDMLTRDIALIPAIIDLVDNSADGAKKNKGEGSLKDYWVRVSISADQFKVTDNCGGIPIETAKKYAFRFGRPAGAPFVKHSVGQFGVGMKRAIFKMGRKFRVESTTRTSRFVVDVDVNAWAKEKNWQFAFAKLEPRTNHSADEVGTTIIVTDLHADVAKTFALENFKSELRNELQVRLQDPISRGLATTLNNVPIAAEPMMILSDPRLAPAHKALYYSEKNIKPVSVELYCGIGRSTNRSEERAAAGWHVFCNGRLILEGDKSEVTGWGAETEDFYIPGFHGQFNNLRGFAYFDSDDPARLPWNTTKTGINTDSPVYRAAKLEMMQLMRPVIDFLNRLKEEKQEKDDPDDKGPLEKIIESAKPVAIDDVETRKVFTSPVIKNNSAAKAPAMQRIQYDAPLDKVLAVKQALRATSYKEVGEGTFDYFYIAEVEE